MSKKGDQKSQEQDSAAQTVPTTYPVPPVLQEPVTIAEANGAGKVIESKSDKFRRLRKVRWEKAEKAILAFAPLSSATYVSTPEQRAVIIALLHGAVDSVAQKWAGKVERVVSDVFGD